MAADDRQVFKICSLQHVYSTPGTVFGIGPNDESNSNRHRDVMEHDLLISKDVFRICY